MKILNLGSLNIDHVYSVPHIVRPGETLSSSALNIFAGGKGANQSVALAKAGAQVFHGGKIGKDGLWLLDKLSCYKVNTENIKIYDGPTGHAIIQLSENAQNSILLFGGGNQSLLVSEVDDILKGFDKGDYLVLQNEINLMPEIIQKAHEKGMIICLNPAPYDKRIREWPLALVDILVVNEVEGKDLAGIEGNFDEILDTLTTRYEDKEIIMTLGTEGSLYGKNKERIFSPIIKTKAVDTTAAGDTYFGYFLASRLEGISVEDSMRKAARASSITVSRGGAMDSIPMKKELDQ